MPPAPSAIPRPVQALVDELSRLPGIGPKTASRLTYFLLRQPLEQVRALAEALTALKERIRFCSVCFNMTESDPCPLCLDEQRDAGAICVVEEPLDVSAVERTRSYHGKYHVLHGAISPVDDIGPDDLRIKELLGRLRGPRPVREVIIATNPSYEGEATAMYLQKQIAPLGVKVTRLARGLPVGGDLEYADETTLARALEGRSEM
ncbi:MAG: recombination protein RecR [Chloroflexi bacterium]|nr:recombination protein RecR [Chloroflexota bacterium]MBI2976009.1 recombination protein RecR [Chloroflexota bacterium]MBI3176972.1 recombination protein RecR [Chloroflexota bacterium]MBI4315267.1 recombination protein RecR [Chloroflexota bacterium]